MTYLATYLATIFAEMRPRLSKFLQRRLRLRAEGASSHQERFFSEELLLSASVLFLPVLYMTAALALLSGVGLSDTGFGRWVFPTGLLLWGVAVVMLHRKERWQRLAITLLLFLAVFAFAVWATRFVLDTGHDSRLYHTEALLALLEGINPYSLSARWIAYSYPAAHWLLSASFILWTQSFEASFAFTLIAVVATFLCARRFFTTLPHLSRRWRNVLAFLLAVNPIAALSFFAHYTDGLLASTLLSVFFLMLCFVSEDRGQSRTTRLRVAVYVVALLVLLVNLKFTGLVFGGILGLTALAYGVRRGASRKTLLHLAGLGSGAAILGIVLFGFYPYATNVMRGKHLFYPAVQFDEQGNKTDTLAEWLNPQFYDKSSYEKWWISLFSQHKADSGDPDPTPPFSYMSVQSFHYGFSSFFSGSMLLCLTLVFFVRHRGAWIVMAGVMASVLSTEASFEFRLTPQNWWLPLLFLVFLSAPDDGKKILSRAQKVVVFFVIACLLYISVGRIVDGKYAVRASRVVRQAELQGGWFVVPDTTPEKRATPLLFRYYKSGLSGVRLPALSECPDTAEKRRLLYGLVLCRP